MEEDRLESLPGRTYAIGFVRSYAGYLGLDAGGNGGTLQAARFPATTTNISPTMAPMPDERRRLPYGWRVVAGIVVLAVGYGIYHLLSASPAPQVRRRRPRSRRRKWRRPRQSR